MTEPEQPRFNLRLTPDLQKRIKHAAVDNGRSVNAEILARLERSFAPDPATALAELLAPIASLDEAQRARITTLLAEAVDIVSEKRRKK